MYNDTAADDPSKLKSSVFVIYLSNDARLLLFRPNGIFIYIIRVYKILQYAIRRVCVIYRVTSACSGREAKLECVRARGGRRGEIWHLEAVGRGWCISGGRGRRRGDGGFPWAFFGIRRPGPLYYYTADLHASLETTPVCRPFDLGPFGSILLL